MLSDEAMQKLLGEPADGDQERARQQLEDLIQQIIERMMEQGFITGAPDLDKEREHRRGHRRRRRRGRRPGDVRGHRQGAGLPRLSGAARSARLDRPQRLRTARHASPEHRRRNRRGAEALRVRRHAEHRSEQHDSQRGPADRRSGSGGIAARPRIPDPDPASTSTIPI